MSKVGIFLIIGCLSLVQTHGQTINNVMFGAPMAIAIDRLPNKPPLLDSIRSNIHHSRRTWAVAGVHAGFYGGSMVLLNQAWYKNYPRSSFHVFNDLNEWEQVDKVGHSWTAYQISRLSMMSWKWAGLTPKQQVWFGGLSGMVFQTVIEVQDGFSAEWGWSWGDIAANTLGSGMLIAQELGWKEQRIAFKFSAHRMNYKEPMLRQRSDTLFGASLAERTLKDYNGQTYWLSANIKAFAPKSRWPAWLNVSIGYGASGIFGGVENIAQDKQGNIIWDRRDIARSRQWYIAPDVDFTRIKTNSKLLKTVFFALNAIKFPAPALAFSGGKFRLYAMYF